MSLVFATTFLFVFVFFCFLFGGGGFVTRLSRPILSSKFLDPCCVVCSKNQGTDQLLGSCSAPFFSYLQKAGFFHDDSHTSFDNGRQVIFCYIFHHWQTSDFFAIIGKFNKVLN